jgi:hypothetical protein
VIHARDCSGGFGRRLDACLHTPNLLDPEAPDSAQYRALDLRAYLVTKQRGSDGSKDRNPISREIRVPRKYHLVLVPVSSAEVRNIDMRVHGNNLGGHTIAINHFGHGQFVAEGSYALLIMPAYRLRRLNKRVQTFQINQ